MPTPCPWGFCDNRLRISSAGDSGNARTIARNLSRVRGLRGRPVPLPLNRDALALSKAAGTDCQIVLLGGIATPKYTKPLLEIFGERTVLSC